MSLLVQTNFQSLLDLLMPMGNTLNHYCLSHASQRTPSPFYRSLICGAPLPPEEKHLFIELGLYHQMVISGLHLSFSDRFTNTSFKQLHWMRWLIYSLLLITTNWSLPLLRAIGHKLLVQANQKLKLNAPPAVSTLCSVSLVLIVFPWSLFSLSLLLSWSATLGLGLPTKNPWIKSLGIYFCTLPVLLLATTNTPLAAIYNVISAPLFCFVLFPITIVGFFTPWLDSHCEMIWRFYLEFLSLLVPTSLHISPQKSPNLFYLWGYLFVLQLAFWRIDLQRRNNIALKEQK